jgi:hypothetical protein
VAAAQTLGLERDDAADGNEEKSSETDEGTAHERAPEKGSHRSRHAPCHSSRA